MDPDAQAPPAPPLRGALLTLAVAFAAFAAALLLYTTTLAPSVGAGEAARIQVAAARLELGGAADARPLSVAFAHLAVRWLPIGDAAYRANLASALAAALAVAAVFGLALALLDATGLGGSPRGRLLFAAAGAASLAVAAPFWAGSVIAGPTPVNVLLIAVVTWLWVARFGGAGSWTIALGSFLLGLGLVNQRGLALVAPVYLIAGIAVFRQPRAVVLGLALGLAPLLVLAAAGGVGQAIGGPYAIHPLVPSLALFAGRITAAFLLSLVLAAAGLLALLLRGGARPAGVFLLAVAAVAKLASAVTSSPVTAVWVVAAVWVAIGAAVLFRRATPAGAALLALVVVAVPVAASIVLPRIPAPPRIAPWIAPLPPWRAGDRAAHAHAQAVLDSLPPGAVLAAGPDLHPTLRYLIEVEKRSAGESAPVLAGSPAEIEALLAEHVGRGRPLVLAGLDPQLLAVARNHAWLVPRGPAFLAEARPSAIDAAERDFAEGKWWDAAYHYGIALGAGAASPGPDLLARWAVALAESGFPDLAATAAARHAAAAGDSALAAQALGAAYFQAGTIHESRGDKDAARRAYERCLGLSPEHAAAGERLAKLAGSW